MPPRGARGLADCMPVRIKHRTMHKVMEMGRGETAPRALSTAAGGGLHNGAPRTPVLIPHGGTRSVPPGPALWDAVEMCEMDHPGTRRWEMSLCHHPVPPAGVMERGEHRTIPERPAAPTRARPGAHMGTGAADRLLSPLWLPTPNPLATFRLPRGHRRKGVPRTGAGAAGAQLEVGAGLCRAKAPPGAASAPLEPCPEGGPGLRSPLPCWRWSLGSGQRDCRVQRC